MRALKIFFLVLLIILFIPVHVNLKYNHKFTGYLRYLIWRKNFSPNNKKNKKTTTLKKELISKDKNSDVAMKKINLNKKSTPKHNFLKQAKKIKQFVSKKMLKNYIHLLKYFFYLGVRTKITVNFKFFVKDMEKTGTLYGTVCTALALISIPKNFNVFIMPNFAEQKSKLKFNLKANIYPIGVLVIGLCIIIRLIYDVVRFKIFSRKQAEEVGK